MAAFHLTKDLSARQFGRLTVLSHAGSRQGNALWLCRCACGAERLVLGTNLVKGQTKSCGCQKREATTTRNRLNATHRMTDSRTYETWHAMKQRCHNPKHRAFGRYGGRGITVCARWKDSFENFLADMGERPPAKSIDRINNNGNYEPGNCRWKTQGEQRRNASNLAMLTFWGRTQCLCDWADELGINRNTLRNRLFKSKWSVEKALTTPLLG